MENTFFNVSDLVYHNIGPVNLDISKQETIGITGPSGCGKTLFLRCLADLDAYSGVVSFQGKMCNDFRPPQWRRIVGMLPAESQWWFDTVGEHFNNPNIKWLQTLGFSENILSWPVTRLSSGEKQRLALLRLLACSPRVLLLDEPTANLDSQLTQKVELFIKSYQAKHHAAIFWVSHNLEQLSRVAVNVYAIRDTQFCEEKK